jgi:NADH-quinone oxidoreductase subunit F
VGEETALIESLEGNRGMPRLKPPFFPAAKGLYMQPTIVNNVETLANLPWIVLNGGDSYKALGGPTSTGTRMFAVSGHVNRPGVFEVPNGVTTFRDLFGTRVLRRHPRRPRSRPSSPVGHRPVVLRGAPRPAPRQAHGRQGRLDARLRRHRRHGRHHRHGEGLLAGGALLRPGVCGKCTPCREGTTWLERILKRILDGHGRPEDLDLLLDVSDNISPGLLWPPRQTTICPLGPSAVSPIASAVARFRPEFEHYIEHGRALVTEPANV